MMNAEDDAWSFLSELEMFGIKLGLENVRRLLELAGNPQQSLKFIHVAGSNGKGSVCAMASAALNAAGFTTGFYSSPHLISLKERFRVNGKAVSDEELLRMLEFVRPKVDLMRREGACPTFFEVTTVMSLLLFAWKKLDFVLWETGMGGRLDATNVVDPTASVITGISLEHQQYLGDTLAKIAFEKAGIIKHERPVFCAELDDEALEVMRRRAAEENAPFHLADESYALENLKISAKDNGLLQSFRIKNYDMELGLPGEAQRKNVKLVFMLLEYLSEKFKFDIKAALRGLSAVRWPGRFQLLPDGSLLDGAHNPEGAEYLVKFLNEYFPTEKFSIVFGNFRDKETGRILSILAPKAAEFIFVPINGGHNRPCCSGDELKKLLRVSADIPTYSASSLEEALGHSVKARRLFCGSLYLAGALLKELNLEKSVFDVY